MDIIISELPNPNLNKILIALLRDVQEDLPEYADAVRLIYGDYIADGVNALSKKAREGYLTPDDIKACGGYLEAKKKILADATAKIIKKYPDKSFMAEKKIKEKELIPYMDDEQVKEYRSIEEKLTPFAEIAKEKRDEDYFGHLNDLNDDYLNDKFADRIDNLRDFRGITKGKATHKVQETEKYFLKVAKKRNKTAYNLMMEAIGENIVPVEGNIDGETPHIFGDSNQKYELGKILNMKAFSMVVRKMEDNIEIENTHIFKLLLGYFNQAHGKNLSPDNLLYSRSSFDAFVEFVLSCILKRYLVIEEACENQFLLGMKNLRKKYNQNLRSIDIYYDLIVEKIFYPKGLTKQDPEVREQMYFFDQAYSLMKIAFKNNKRESGERYFEHIKGVTDTIIGELQNPNLNKILISLLHDVQEDMPEYADAVRLIYGDYIADGVNALSKKPRESYLTPDDIKVCGGYLEAKKKILADATAKIIKKYPDKSFMAEKKIKEKELIPYMEKEQVKEYRSIEEKLTPFAEIAKEKRNEDYFGHLDDLNDDYLDVKLADRINNLRDIRGLTREKAIRKVQETEKYFLEVAKKRNKTAYDLMIDAIQKNKEKFNF